MSSTEDKAERVLIEQGLELHPKLPKDLIVACHRAEREHQFDREPDLVVAGIRQLIDHHLQAEMAANRRAESTAGRKK